MANNFDASNHSGRSNVEQLVSDEEKPMSLNIGPLDK
jgi:hypothetical protein